MNRFTSILLIVFVLFFSINQQGFSNPTEIQNIIEKATPDRSIPWKAIDSDIRFNEYFISTLKSECGFKAFGYASKEIAIIGPSSREAMAYLYRTFLPNKVLAMSVGPVNDIPLLKGREAIDGKATFYVCENQTCQLPTNDIEAAKKIISGFKKYDL